MLTESKAFSGFAVTDLEAAEEFYGTTLGVKTEVIEPGVGLMTLRHPGDHNTFVYRKPDLEPANYTILNFPVDDIDAAVDELAGRGVEFERYDGFDQDERGIARGAGPPIAWFKD